MMEEERHLSLSKILWTDYPAFYASLLPLAAWMVFFAWFPKWTSSGPVIGPEARPLYLTLILAATAGGIAAAASRIFRFRQILRNGCQVRAKIIQIELVRDHGRIDFAYIFNHQEYLESASVHRNAEIKTLRNGDQVMLIVDRTKPSRAFIRDLYTRP